MFVAKIDYGDYKYFERIIIQLNSITFLPFVPVKRKTLVNKHLMVLNNNEKSSSFYSTEFLEFQNDSDFNPWE